MHGAAVCAGQPLPFLKGQDSRVLLTRQVAAGRADGSVMPATRSVHADAALGALPSRIEQAARDTPDGVVR